MKQINNKKNIKMAKQYKEKPQKSQIIFLYITQMMVGQKHVKS